jgi:hypothetical protein
MILKFTEQAIKRGQQSLIVEFKDQMSARDLHTHGGLFLYFPRSRILLTLDLLRRIRREMQFLMPFGIPLIVDAHGINYVRKSEFWKRKNWHYRSWIIFLTWTLSSTRVSHFIDLTNLGMRINPTVSVGHRREVPIDTVIAGHLVPAGVPPSSVLLTIRQSFQCQFIPCIILSLTGMHHANLDRSAG